jgi:hypothetical protein
MARFAAKTIAVILLCAAFASCCHVFLASHVTIATIRGACHNHGKSQPPESHQCCSASSHDALVVVAYRFAPIFEGFEVVVLSLERRPHERQSFVQSVCSSPPNTTSLRI